MIRRSKSLLLALLTLATAVYLYATTERALPASARGNAASDDSQGETAARLKMVRVALVESARDARELRFSGTIRAARRARLAFTTHGRLVARPVEIGDQVRRGQLLAQLTELEPRNALVSARAALAELSARRAQSTRDHARAEQLAAAKAATGEELERAAAAVDALEAAEEAAGARLLEAQRRLDETSLQAPFDGTVTEVHFEPGEYARAGTPVVTLSGDGELEVEVEVPESVIAHVVRGDQVELRLGFLGTSPARPVADQDRLVGRIKSAGRTVAGPGRLFPVVAALPAGTGATAGATAELVLRLSRDQALALPVEAVVNPGGRRPSVFRVTDGSEPRVEKVEVEVGTLLGDAGGVARVIVRGALAAGDRIVTGGQRGLLDGEQVEIEESGAER